MKKRKIEETKGITLVALVVTIVVLLILAGITITMLFSENGIIKKAQEAANKTADDKVNTEEGLNNLTNQMNNALNGDSDKAPKIEEKGKLVPVETKYATYTDDTGSAPIPGGYCVVKDATIGGTLKENKVGTGLVISDVANDDLDNTAQGNQFVWVPVNSEQLNKMYGTTGTGANAKKFGKLYEFGSKDSSTNLWTPYTEPKALNWDANGIKLTSGTGSYREPDVVTYYDGFEATKSSYFKAAISETMTGAEFKTQIEREFDKMIKSVEAYDGFYIGRYETGSWTTDIPKVQKGQTVGGVNWYQQYAQTKNLGKIKNESNEYVDNPNVEASMIWGCQFDRTLEWIAQTNLKDGNPNYSLLTDSSSWGNYKNYKTVTGDESTESGKILSSGTNQNWQKNNIFDLAGNAYDWTIEVNETNGRVTRGAYYSAFGSSFPAFFRVSFSPDSSNNYYSSRATLYIKVNADSDTP